MSPLDPTIPLSVRPFQGVNILAIQENQRRQAEEARLAEQNAFERERYQAERQTLQEQQASRKLLGEAFRNAAGPDGIDRQKLMQSVPPEMWLPISEQLDKIDQSSLSMQKTRAELAKLKREEEEAQGEGVRSFGQIMEMLGPTPEAWQGFRTVAANSPTHQWGTEEQLIPFDTIIAQDPTKIPAVIAAMKTYRKATTAQKNEDFTLSEGQIRYGPGGQVIAKGPEKSLTSQNPTQASLALAAAGEGPEAERARAALAMLTKETGRNPTEASIALEAAGGDAAKAFRMLNAPKPGDERLVQVMGLDGVARWVRESQAVGKPSAQAARAPTGQERQTLAFYNRAQNAVDNIMGAGGRKDLETEMANANLVQQGRLKHAPDFALTTDQANYRQAQRSFTEARLRKESGAAIPESEFENDARTYFAQPGDNAARIKQKREARQVVLDGLKFASGRAYEEYYGEPAPKANAPKVETVERGPDGKLKLVK